MFNPFSLKNIVEKNVPYVLFSAYKTYDLYRAKKDLEDHTKIIEIVTEKKYLIEWMWGIHINIKKKTVLMNEKMIIVPLNHLSLIK